MGKNKNRCKKTSSDRESANLMQMLFSDTGTIQSDHVSQERSEPPSGNSHGGWKNQKGYNPPRNDSDRRTSALGSYQNDDRREYRNHDRDRSYDRDRSHDRDRSRSHDRDRGRSHGDGWGDRDHSHHQEHNDNWGHGSSASQDNDQQRALSGSTNSDWGRGSSIVAEGGKNYSPSRTTNSDWGRGSSVVAEGDQNYSPSRATNSDWGRGSSIINSGGGYRNPRNRESTRGEARSGSTSGDWQRR